MKLVFTRRAQNDYDAFPPNVQKLAANSSISYSKISAIHRSRQRSHDEARGIWQARITRDYRVHFLIEGDEYVILTMIKHPK